MSITPKNPVGSSVWPATFSRKHSEGLVPLRKATELLGPFSNTGSDPNTQSKESSRQLLQLPSSSQCLSTSPLQLLRGSHFLSEFLCLLGYLRSTTSVHLCWARRNGQCWLCVCCAGPSSTRLTLQTPHISPGAQSHLCVLTCLVMASKGFHLKLAWLSKNCSVSCRADMPNPHQYEIIHQTLVIVLLWKAGCF